MDRTEKFTSAKRQALILDSLKAEHRPITGSEFAQKANVSRQVIVQDVSILKAKNEPIIATSQGYMYIQETPNEAAHKLIIACKHHPDQTENELNIIVDHGVLVKDVTVEHPVYGDLTASLMVSNRSEVQNFIKKIQDTNAAYLSTLTEGIHMHTIEADTKEKIEAACEDLKKADILL
ncbi:transcription repressor NadR [Virgibacillus phasianinus]|uniref:Transcription repressor NadR n=1 Tax=Virgibacillus phasianinus TaxID=2017483 RepID=A0A220U360_9BACI|nr:transcription repressor NadR [Virgibacillus phasianinus]ASK62579.1 transcription repressor NadR [Virgibacillus phasianinus]